jgi:hypothetical protein
MYQATRSTMTRTVLTTRSRRATICLLLCIWLELCTTLTEAVTNYGGGGSSIGGGFGSSTGTTITTTTTSGSSNNFGSPTTTTFTSTSTSQGVGGSLGTGGAQGFVFFGSGHRTTHTNNNNSNNNGNNNEDEMPLVWIVLFWILMATIFLGAIGCMLYYCKRGNSNNGYEASRFNSRVSQAKNQVQKRRQDSSSNSNVGQRPPAANGNYMATYAINGEAFSSTMMLSFSPNIVDQDTNTWLICGKGKNFHLLASGENTMHMCAEFSITEGLIAASGHAYWVQQQSAGNNVTTSRSLTTGKFDFDGGQSASNNGCSFTGCVMKCDGTKAEYASFQLELEKESEVVVHETSSYATTDLESNIDGGDNATAAAAFTY